MLRALFSFRDRDRILHLTWFSFFLSFVVWFSFAPFATTIQRELHYRAATESPSDLQFSADNSCSHCD
jgi:nitrate/nitrite transporter NarK